MTHQNFNNVPHSFNICEALGRMHKCPSVKLGVLVIGTLGEIVFTDTHRQFIKYYGELDINERKIKTLYSQISLEVCNATAKILLQRMNVNDCSEN